MGQISMNGIPLEDVKDDTKTDQSEEREFVRLMGTREVGIKVCAVSRDKEAVEKDSMGYKFKSNQDWKINPKNERAWVKIERDWDGINSIIDGVVQSIKVNMKLFGKGAQKCWGELQLRIKEKIVRNQFVDGRMQKQTINLRPVLVGRHRSFDTRIGKFGEWAAETQPIRPKEKQGQTKNNIDQKTHYYLPFRFYHQDYLPETPGDWHWEPVYVAIAGKEFYRLDLLWEQEEITISVTPLDPNSPEIPEHIKPREFPELASIIKRAR